MTKIKQLILKILWYLLPLWLTDKIYKKTGYIFGAKFDNGKPIQFYLFKNQHPDFKVTYNED